jgi:hypothetical protein
MREGFFVACPSALIYDDAKIAGAEGKMPYPMTHLYIADRILDLRPMPEENAASFLLGGIAPDGVHFRPGFTGADKKITHLCPVSDERWGRVTENDKWLGLVLDYKNTKAPADAFILGYCAHIISDICNNRELWIPYFQNNPEDAGKGYGSDYYKEWEQIDARLFQELKPGSRIINLLPKAKSRHMPGLVTAAEIDAIRGNVLFADDIFISYPNKPPADTSNLRYLSFERVKQMIDDAAVSAEKELFAR